jgi:predicted DNA-binding protein (UPF0251 family)
MRRVRHAFPPLLAALCICTMLAPSTVPAQVDLDVRAATEIVLRQLEAFRLDDYDAAYAYASATIRQTFDRAAFERMVRDGYPEIARSVSAVVADATLAPNGSVLLRLRILGANGRRVEALYALVFEDGRFHVDGVITTPDPSESA